jgi:phospholipid/cholesterol/gamma-HCH transport system substrate-binding protein
MPQRKEITWGQLRVGVMVGVAIIIIIVGIFLLSGQAGILGGRYKLNAYFPGAGGLRGGAEVDLAGVPVGNVDRIRLSNSQDPSRAVVVVLRIQRKFQNDIRGDSVATIQTAGLLGESFVDVTRGTARQPALPNGGELATQASPDIRAVMKNANDVLSNLTNLSSQLSDITKHITAGKGTIGEFIYDAALYNQVNDTVAKLQGMLTKISNGQGTLGQLVASDAMANKLNSTLDRANQMLDQIQHGNGTMAKLINDPTLYNNLNEDLTEIKGLVANINQGDGTLGKLAKDPELYNRLNLAASNIDSITGRMAQGKGSLGLLSTDTKLYDNLSASMQSLREFLTEFRKNPKKYLTLHIRIF